MARKTKSDETPAEPTTVAEFKEAPREERIEGRVEHMEGQPGPFEPLPGAVDADGNPLPPVVQAPDLAPFGRFVRATGNGVATRYGSPSEQIGLRRNDQGELRVDTELVVALTVHEAEKYRREYDRQVREGALEDVDGAAYLASLGFGS